MARGLQLPAEGKKRVVIEDVAPEIDCGRFAAKRTVGEAVQVRAAVFGDGHDLISCHALYRPGDESEWQTAPMLPAGNDCWEAEFRVSKLGKYFFTVEGWVDRFKTWRADLRKRIAAGQDLTIELEIGARLIEDAAKRASEADAAKLLIQAKAIRSGDSGVAVSDELFATMQRNPELALATRYDRELAVQVDRVKARFSTWYEFFPRSTAREPGAHGTFRDCEAHLPYVASMAFDVVYLPPIHPVGHTFRKGKNNSPVAQPGEEGSPWAIGDESGGHTAIHPQLGTLEDFQSLLATAKSL
ncbi:MAG: hypothetical protein QOJ99_926, partial [Bryobacterales bacterium]|nr:hypothetical protein [Bryobacterales bacterium]